MVKDDELQQTWKKALAALTKKEEDFDQCWFWSNDQWKKYLMIAEVQTKFDLAPCADDIAFSNATKKNLMWWEAIWSLRDAQT